MSKCFNNFCLCTCMSIITCCICSDTCFFTSWSGCYFTCNYCIVEYNMFSIMLFASIFCLCCKVCPYKFNKIIIMIYYVENFCFCCCMTIISCSVCSDTCFIISWFFCYFTCNSCVIEYNVFCISFANIFCLCCKFSPYKFNKLIVMSKCIDCFRFCACMSIITCCVCSDTCCFASWNCCNFTCNCCIIEHNMFIIIFANIFCLCCKAVPNKFNKFIIMVECRDYCRFISNRIFAIFI